MKIIEGIISTTESNADLLKDVWNRLTNS